MKTFPQKKRSKTCTECPQRPMVGKTKCFEHSRKPEDNAIANLKMSKPVEPPVTVISLKGRDK